MAFRPRKVINRHTPQNSAVTSFGVVSRIEYADIYRREPDGLNFVPPWLTSQDQAVSGTRMTASSFI